MRDLWPMVGGGAVLGLVSVVVLRRGVVIAISLGALTGVLGVVPGVVLGAVIAGFVGTGKATAVWTSVGTVGVMSEGGMGDMGG